VCRVVSFAAVAEVVFRCKTTDGVVEKRFEHDAQQVDVCRSSLMLSSHISRRFHLQLWGIRLTEVPSELLLFHLKTLRLDNNKLCSLPSELERLTMLEGLYVRLSNIGS
jgi:Leucine-rich repeat (LRR) protein